MTTIRGLKQKTGRLKNLMENPYSEKKAEMRLSGDTHLQLTREYLSIAKQAYVESGGTYTLSKSEEWAVDFDSNLEAISKITFSIGGFFDGYRKHVVEISEELKTYTKLWEGEDPLILLNDNKELFTKDAFIAALRELHIGEWRRLYSTNRFGYRILDGTQWELGVEYSSATTDTVVFFSYYLFGNV